MVIKDIGLLLKEVIPLMIMEKGVLQVYVEILWIKNKFYHIVK